MDAGKVNRDGSFGLEYSEFRDQQANNMKKEPEEVEELVLWFFEMGFMMDFI